MSLNSAPTSTSTAPTVTASSNFNRNGNPRAATLREAALGYPFALPLGFLGSDQAVRTTKRGSGALADIEGAARAEPSPSNLHAPSLAIDRRGRE